MLDRDAIKKLVPHGGDMVLIDRVVRWTTREIVCRADTHGDPKNPLRCNSCLPALSGIEYGAQAMAIHGTLIAGNQVRTGLLGGLRNLVCHVERLDDVAGRLRVQASLLYGQQDGYVYEFALQSDTGTLLEGQATVRLT